MTGQALTDLFCIMIQTEHPECNICYKVQKTNFDMLLQVYKETLGTTIPEVIPRISIFTCFSIPTSDSCSLKVKIFNIICYFMTYNII